MYFSFLLSCRLSAFHVPEVRPLSMCRWRFSVFHLRQIIFIHFYWETRCDANTISLSHMLTHSLKKGSLLNICGIFERSLKFPLDKKRFFDYENVLHTKGNGSFKKCSLKGSSGNPEWDLFGISVLKECILIIL